MNVPKYGTLNYKSQPWAISEIPPGSYFRRMFGHGFALELHEVCELRARGPLSIPTARLSDPEIRAALRPLTDTASILEEVECWRGYARADFICFSADALSVVEIKSDLDSLRRFDEQIRVYSAIADQVTLIVGWSLAARALRAAPTWWNVVLAEREEEAGIRFVPLRDGMENPGSVAEGLAAMLPLDGLRRLASQSGLNPTKLRGEELRRIVTLHVGQDQVRGAVATWLTDLSKRRAGMTS